MKIEESSTPTKGNGGEHIDSSPMAASPRNKFLGLRAQPVQHASSAPSVSPMPRRVSSGACGASCASSADASTTAETRSQGKLEKKGKRATETKNKCRVCGLSFEDMPRNGKECYEHQQDAAGLQKDLEAKAKRDPGNPQTKADLQWFKEQRKTAGPPPSPYSKEVLAFSQACPSRGAGKARACYNQFRQMEETVAQQEAKVGVRAVKMHKERFMIWATGTACVPAEYADAWWKRMFKEFDHNDILQVDQLGPSFSKLQLAVPTENFSEGSLSEQHNKRMQLLSKAKKVGSEEELEKAQAATQSGHATFGDKTFANTGGALMAQLGNMGATGIISSTGATQFSQPSGSKPGSENKVGADAVIEKEKDKPKKAKKFEVPFHRAKLQEAIIDPSTGQYSILNKTTSETMDKAVATLKVAEDLRSTMPGVEKWMAILQDRISWLENALYGMDKTCSDITIKPEWNISLDSEYANFNLAILAVNSARTHVHAETAEGIAAAARFDHLKQIEDLMLEESFPNSWAKMVLSNHGLVDGSFTNPLTLDLEKLENELDEMVVARVSVVGLDRFMATQKCAPIDEPDRLMPLCSLKFMALSTRNCEDEHDIKELSLYFEGARDSLKELVKSVLDSARQVASYVEQQRTAEIQKAEKEKETEAKDRIKAEKAALKKAEQDLKKEQKQVAAGIEKGFVDENKPSELFTQTSDKVRALPRYDTSVTFQKDHPAKADVPVDPYCIDRCPDLDKLFDDKDVKGAHAIFSVQFSCAVKKDGKGQVPMISTRNIALRETILDLGPKTLDLKMSGAGLPKNIQAVKNFLQSISHFGYTAKCIINGENERFGMASFRYQTRGKRQVMFIRFDDLLNFFPLKVMADKLDKDMFTILAPTRPNHPPPPKKKEEEK